MRASALVVIAALALACLRPTAARAAEAAPDASDRLAIETVISRQLEAFQHDDGAAAFAFASPTIQGKFGTAEAFMEMVRRAYRPVYRPRDVRFDELLVHEGQLVQRVILIGPEQQVVIALYEMQRQPGGEWRINGCFLLQAPEQAT